jgi:ribosomal protein S18 acetylase RimI-like enzyme
MTITYKRDLDGVDWVELKATLAADHFDNGRTPEQLRASFENSYSTCLACDGDRIVGTARVLSDGVCNAYIVDVWTLTSHRRRGLARTMMQQLLDELPGQHVYLFTDDALDFYKAIGFVERPIGLEKVVGEWLVNKPATT